MTDFAALLSHLSEHIHPLDAVSPDADDTDLETFAAMVGDARIVGLGEATHGTREFHLLRHRLIRFLVENHGFRLIGIEASWADCLAINRYVFDGEGDIAEAVANNGFWMWDVWEFRELLEWLRQHNAAQAWDQRVRVFGFDATSGRTAVELIWQLIRRVDPEYAVVNEALRGRLAELSFYEMPKESDLVAADIEEISRYFTVDESRYRRIVTPQEWENLCQGVSVIRHLHATSHAAHGAEKFSARDRAMASRVEWQTGQLAPDVRTILMAHNGHVTTDHRGMFDSSLVTMGECLARRYGDDYVSVGLFFGEGSFQAIVDPEHSPKLDEVEVGLPPAGSLDAALMDASPAPALLLDTRTLPEDLRLWIAGPLVSRENGAAFEGEPAMHSTIWPASRHDVIAFVRSTTRARPTPTGIRPPWQ